MLPQRDTFLNVYKVLSLNLLPSKIKETTVQTANKTIWEGNKAYKSGMALDPICQYCEELETMKHLLYADKLLSQYKGNSWLCSYSSLFSSYGRLHSNQNPSFNGNCVQQTQTLHSSPPSKKEYVKRVIPTFQEVELDIILRNAQLKAPRRQEELQTHIQAHLLSVVKKN